MTRSKNRRPKQSIDAKSDHEGRWGKVKDVAVGALVGSLVALVLTPLSQSLTHYFSQLLSRAILSVEHIELVHVEPRTRVESLRFRQFLRSTSAQSLMATNADLRSLIASMHEELPREHLSQLKLSAERLLAEFEAAKHKIERYEQLVAADQNGVEIARIAAEYHGPMLGSFPYADQSPDDMRQPFVAQLHADKAPFVEASAGLIDVISAVTTTSVRVTNFKMKVSVLNRGDTDGLIRSSASAVFNNSNLVVPLTRIGAPKADFAVQPFAVSVAVTNPSPGAAVREHSVGRVEKHTMTEFWFEVDEYKLAPNELASVAVKLPAKKGHRLRLTLSDQDYKTIIYEGDGL